MHPLIKHVRAQRVEAARKFAAQFSEREWKYLCSHQWFLSGVSDGFDSGDFFALQAKTEKALRDSRIRKPPLVVTIGPFTPYPWFGFL